MQLLAYWGLLLAAACYAALAVWRMAISRDHAGSVYLGLAFGGMAIWNIAVWTDIGWFVIAGEIGRDLGWLGYLFGITRSLEQQDQVRRKIRLFSVFLLFLLVVRTVASLTAMSVQVGPSKGIFQLLLATQWLYVLVGIFFAHYLFRATATLKASGFRLITAALGAMWAYSLNVFTLLLLGYQDGFLLAGLGGVVTLLLVPAFALAARRKEYWKVALSRQATTQSLLLIALGTYFVIISTATRAISWAGVHAERPARLLIPILITGFIFVVGILPRPRAQIKALLVRNLFEHRYDYRNEWLRFASTMGNHNAPGLSVEERAIRSMIDVTESVGGALLSLERGDRLAIAATLGWPGQELSAHVLPANPAWVRDLERTGRIITLDDVRAGSGGPIENAAVPDWLLCERHAWALVPLLRANHLVGLILLGRPRLERELDWEDLDLLKVIAEQVAVHLADARSQMELEEARRFEEFNRRFAFIIHDIKNVVSQLSLVSRNAVEHGRNPKFQASMALTLENATSKMSTLLARLSSQRMPIEQNLTSISPSELLRALARRSEFAGRIAVAIEQECIIHADEEQLLEALGHLLANALEASPSGEAVQLSLSISEQSVVIRVEDRGCGMSPQFVRNGLFKAFASTKPNGFGIGAAEARSLIHAMGGDLDVISVEGQGTRFLIKLPLQSLGNDRS